MSCVFALAILFGSLQHAHGQLNQGGTPFSFDFDNKNLNTVEFVQMEQVDLEALRAEDRVNDFEPATPFRFGKNLEVNLNPSNSGVWDEVKEGYNIWRLGITSPGARSINLMFDEYELPEGATLYIYNKKRTDIIGAFTHHNNQEDGMFATTLVAGDEIIIEYFEPAGVEFEARLNLAQVTHGYRAYGETDKFGSSGSCNLNVACEEADGWEEQISSAARMVVNGNSWCSGQLINNTNNDGTPYFLSANHCFTSSPVVFWFNYESETCSNPSTPPSHDALSGAVTVSRNSASDFWLMELNDEIPAEYNLFFSGWNRTEEPEIPGYIFGVHHPSGDIKKFSYLFDGVTASSYLGATGSGTTHWRVGTWADATTTEPGSSGSALFDGDGRIIGQLHGGYAACGNTLEDWYGRIGTSWEGGGTPATRLKDWLDPGNTGAEVWDGYNPNLGVVDVDAQITSILSPGGTYSPVDDITPLVRIRNAGILDLTEATVSYTIEGPETAEESISWTGTLETAETEDVEFESINLPVGNYDITATIFAAGDENPDNDTRSASFRVVDCAQPFTMPFEEDFDNGSGIPDCWSVADNQGNGQVWVVGNNGNTRGIAGNSTNYAYLDSDGYGSGNSQDSDLITPTINMSNYENVEISFDHYYRELGSSAGTVSYSVDDGETWTQLEQWNATTPNPSSFSAEIPELDGQSEVRIKWNYVGSWAWYWSVDNIVLDGDMTGPLPTEPATAQLVHNSADPAFASVDIYVNDELAISGFDFRSSLSGVELPSEQEVTLGIAAEGSADIALSTEYVFSESGNYLIIVDGVGDPAEFDTNPNGAPIEAAVRIYSDILSMEPEGDSNIMYFSHGSTDTPNVSVTITNDPPTATDTGFGDIQDDTPILDADLNYIYVFGPSPDEPLFILEADLSMYSGQIIGLFASGFLDPSENQGGEALAFFAVRENGDMIDLRDVPLSNEETTDVPTAFALEQNYPNPFNPTTAIEYALPKQTQVRLEVYNLMGQRVATLVNGTESAGRHTVSFDASRLSSGMYVYRLEAGSYVETRKMMLVK